MNASAGTFAGLILCVFARPGWSQDTPAPPGYPPDQTQLVHRATRLQVDAAGRDLDVFTYLPAQSAPDRPLLIVIHGTLRNAAEYRDHAIPLADRLRAPLAVPWFDHARFPVWRFQHGGLRLPSGALAPRSEWSWPLIPALAGQLEHRLPTPTRGYVLAGHSAGGQFVGRSAAFLDSNARALVAANPSSWVFPRRDWHYPYGLGGLPDSLADDAAIQRYLARPLIIYLGTADTVRDPDLDIRPGADRQGPNRLERGRNFFEAGKSLAREHGWTFRWIKLEAPGVGHDHESMLNHNVLIEFLESIPPG